MEQYDDEEANRARVLGNGQVLAFIAGYWRRRPLRIGATIATTSSPSASRPGRRARPRP
jgi:hypothetical protein